MGGTAKHHTAVLEPHVPLRSVETALKGVIDVPEDKIISFVSPLLGFEHLHEFIIFQTSPGPVYWLQSVEHVQAAFCLLAPFEAGLDPDYEIGAGDVQDIDASDETDIAVYTILVLSDDPTKIRTNLRAPIVLGKQSSKAKQLIMDNNALPVQYFLHQHQAGSARGSHAAR